MMKIALPQSIKLRSLILPGLLVWAAILGGLSWKGFQFLLAGREQRTLARTVELCEIYMQKARELAHVFRYEDAQAYGRQAVALAPTTGLRAQAGITMGEVLLLPASSQPRPFALEARQYFEAVAGLEADAETKLRAYQGIINASALLHEVREVDKACRAATLYATNENDRADLALHQLDVFLEIGDWKDLKGLEPTLKPFMKSPKWGARFELKWSIVMEEVLLRENWFDQYMEDFAGRSREEVRRELLQNTVAGFQKLSESPDIMIRDDSLFRIARLLCHEKQYREAQQYVQLFLENEPSIHLDETLLMLTRMAREEGETVMANDLISTFLKRYRLSTQATREFDAVVAQLEQKGQYADALELIAQYINLPAAKSNLAGYLAQAAELANRIGRYEQGAVYFDDLLKLNPDSKILAAALLDQGTACIQRNDLAEGEKWLIYFLRKFPHDLHRADAMYKLFDIKVRSKAFAADIVLLGATAVAVAPTDPRAMNALLIMAGILERVGLPALAEIQYKKIGLLNATAGVASRKEPLPRAIGESMLGGARCLLQMGEVIKADHLLRELCANFNVDPVKSEAAYWWAALAMDRGQTREAERRLALADADRATPEIGARLDFEKNLLEIAGGASVTGTLDRLLSRLSDLPPSDYGEFLRRAYTVYFDKLAARRDIPAMQKLLSLAAANPQSDQLPLRVFFLKTAQLILADQGPKAFIGFLEEQAGLAKAADSGLARDRSYLLDEITRIEQRRDQVDEFIGDTGGGT